LELEEIHPTRTGAKNLTWNQSRSACLKLEQFWSSGTGANPLRQELEKTLLYGTGGHPPTWNWSKKPQLGTGADNLA